MGGAPSPCGEEFANCADVEIVNEGGQGASPSPSSTPKPPTPAPPAPPVNPAPPAPPAPPSPVGGSCIQNTDCAANAWCNDATYVNWCPMHDASKCPMPQCIVAGGAEPEPEPVPEPEPESEPEVATPAPATSSPAPVATPVPPVSTPAPPLNVMTCTATPGLNRGVTDAACAQCASGYQWWPCNEAVLCECSGGALIQRRNSFLARDHGMMQIRTDL